MQLVPLRLGHWRQEPAGPKRQQRERPGRLARGQAGPVAVGPHRDRHGAGGGVQLLSSVDLYAGLVRLVCS
jgi:hypothetical protein